METTLLNQGFTLMLVGMGTVFFFLTALVGAMSLMAGMVRRFTPLAEDVVSDAEVAAIAAAIALHRSKKS